MADNFPNLSNPFAAALMGPDILQKQYQIQQNQRIADMLMQQSDAPLNGQMVSGHYVGASPMQGLANLFSAYSGRKMMDAIPSQQYDLANMQDKQLDNMLGMGSTPQMTNPSQGQPSPGQPQAMPVGQPGQPQSPPMAGGQPGMPSAASMGINPQLAKQLITFGGPQAYADLIKTNAGMTDLQKTALAAGLQPGTPGYAAAMQGNLAKQNYIAPTSLRPGGYMYDPNTGGTSQLPHVPDGFTSVQGRDGQWTMVPVNGGMGALSASAAAVEGGKGSQLPFTEGRGPTGAPLPITNRTQAATGLLPGQAGAITPQEQALVTTESNGNPGALSPKGAMGAWQVMPNTQANPGFGVDPARDGSRAELDRVGKDYYGAMQKRYGHEATAAIAYNMGPGATDQWLASGADPRKLPAETRNYLADVSARTGANIYNQNKAQPIYAQPPMGATAGAEANAKNQSATMTEDWKSVAGANEKAQSVISFLQNVSKYAPQGSVGRFFAQKDMAASIGSMFGIPAAEVINTANDLTSKNAQQVIAMMGSGTAMGTDAARTILQSANPNVHMTNEALQEAIRTIQAVQQMNQAKAIALQKPYTSGDAKTFTALKTDIDTNADPRIWQWKSMPPGVERDRFAQSLAKQDPTIGEKIKKLSELGVL